MRMTVDKIVKKREGGKLSTKRKNQNGTNKPNVLHNERKKWHNPMKPLSKQTTDGSELEEIVTLQLNKMGFSF